MGPVFLGRSGNVGLLLLLNGSLLEILRGVVGGILLLRQLGAGAGVAIDALLLGGGLAAVLGVAVGSLGLSLKTLDLGLSLGDVLWMFC